MKSKYQTYAEYKNSIKDGIYINIIYTQDELNRINQIIDSELSSNIKKSINMKFDDNDKQWKYEQQKPILYKTLNQ